MLRKGRRGGGRGQEGTEGGREEREEESSELGGKWTKTAAKQSGVTDANASRPTRVSRLLIETCPDVTAAVSVSRRRLLLLTSFLASACFHSLFHFYHRAHRSWLIKGRTRQDNGHRRRSPEKDGEPGSERRTGRWRQNSSVGEDR